MAARRLMREHAELQAAPSPDFAAEPLADNLFEWHFTIRGPPEGGFQHGRFHGRITFPPDYPFKPPNISFLNQNGRFEVGKKICLSITSHHPEFWRPAWGVRTALVAIISFFPTKGEGAIGALDWTEAERRVCAEKSRSWSCSICGAKMSNVLPDESEAPSQQYEVDPEIVLSVRDNSESTTQRTAGATDSSGPTPTTNDESGSSSTPPKQSESNQDASALNNPSQSVNAGSSLGLSINNNADQQKGSHASSSDAEPANPKRSSAVAGRAARGSNVGLVAGQNPNRVLQPTQPTQSMHLMDAAIVVLVALAIAIFLKY